MKIHYAGQPGDGFGWGIANRYLIQELGKLAEVTTFPPNGIPADGWPGVVFMPLADHDFNPCSPARGKVNLAYTFFEFPLGPNAAANAAKYDVVFTGSTWCKERLAEIGVHNTEVLIQGVDHSIFKPEAVPRHDKQFRIFSGGKFEYRKGQDLVLAAFKLLMDKYPEMQLVTAWHNPWPQLYRTMKHSTHIKCPINEHLLDDWPKLLGDILRANEIPRERVLHVATSGGRSVPQSGMAHVMNQTDVGVFPNRCEGGTNLVMMEYMACGKPVVATDKTGHADVSEGVHTIDCGEDLNRWADPTPEQVASEIEHVRTTTPLDICDVSKFTWERTAKQVIDRIKAINDSRAA